MFRSFFKVKTEEGKLFRAFFRQKIPPGKSPNRPFFLLCLARFPLVKWVT